jgi:hypothetical protein
MLSENEIKQIQTYCVVAGLKYYDVELELVDHMAEWIIETMRTQNISFEDALQQLGITFSNEELMEIVAQKRMLIRKKLLRLYKSVFLSYFKFPQIALTFFLIWLVIYFGNTFKINQFPSIAIHVMNLIILTYDWGRGKIVIEYKDSLQQNLLCEKVLKAFPRIFAIPSVLYAILTLANLFYEGMVPILIFKLVLYLFPLFVIVGLSWRKVNIEMHHKIKELYPLAFSY